MPHWGATPDDWAHFSGTLKLREHLLPVVSNPTAKISPNSALKFPGKIPSLYNAQGHIVGVKKWTEHKSTLADLKKWIKNPDYGICIQCHLTRALDCDIKNADLAAKVSQYLVDRGINWPARIRTSSNKFLLAFKMQGQFAKRVIHLKDGDPGDKIEFLADGQHFVALGTHPDGDRYEWLGGLPESIPEISIGDFDKLWADLAAEFGKQNEAGNGDYQPRRVQHTQSTGVDDPILPYLESQNQVLGYNDEGAAYISCPFKVNHSKEGDKTETIYFPAGLRGYEMGHFNCLHASCSEHTDVDFLDAIGYRATMFEDLGPLPAEAIKKPKYTLIPASEFADRPPPEWIIQDILPKGELAVLFGESGSGKSFIALDMAMSIARGIDWNGNPVKQGRVVYIAAESAGGMRNRLRAYAEHHQCSLEGVPLLILPSTPNLLDTADSAALTASIEASGICDVVFIDTLAQTTPGGDENSATDMGKAISNCKKIHQATGAIVVPVHHAGKDLTKGARGWSGLRAAADAEFEVSRTENARFIKISKQKDGEDGREWGVNLLPISIDMDSTGRVMSSCAVEYVNGAKRSPKQKQRGEVEQAVIRAFDELGGADCDLPSLLDLAPKYIPQDPSKKDQRRGRARRAIVSLGQSGYWTVEGDKVYIAL
jgi:hypothetical protein